MATLNEITYDLINLVRGGKTSDDELISTDQIKFWVHNTRSMLIRRDLAKRRTISDNIKQILPCVEVEMVDPTLCCGVTTECTMLRSKQRVPLPIETPSRDMILEVRPLKITDPTFHYIPYNRISWAGNNRYTKRLQFAFMLDGFMYVMGDDINLLEKIAIIGLFSDPTDVARFYTCEDTPCYNDDDVDYPISAHMIEEMKNMIIQNNFQTLLQVQTDSQGNAKHDVKPNQTM